MNFKKETKKVFKKIFIFGKVFKRRGKNFFSNKVIESVLISLVVMLVFLGIIFVLLWTNRTTIISFLVEEYKSGLPVIPPIEIPVVSEEKKEEVIKPVVEEVKKEMPTIIEAVKKAKPAVVSIATLNQETNKKLSSGSGFLVSSDGLIVTNRHVVSYDNSKHIVKLNELEYSATLLDKDPVYDVALLKINGSNFTHLELANSDLLEVGEQVIAIGNALGEFENTVSVGVVSGLSRSVMAEDDGSGEKEYLDKVIQTDTAINKGNSGGPLLNIEGDVVGINVAVIRNSSNIGFALPINSVKDAINSVRMTGKIVRPYVGIRYVLINASIQEKNKLPFDYGIWIKKGSANEPAVLAGSPAEKSGLKDGDIILEIDNKKVDLSTNFSKIIRDKKIGDAILVQVYSAGITKYVSIILEQSPDNL
jgi:serine protease Do